MSLVEPPNPLDGVLGLTQGIEALYANAERTQDIADRAILLTTAQGYMRQIPEQLAKCNHPSYGLTPQQVADARWYASVARTMIDAMTALSIGAEPDEDAFLSKT